MMGRLAAIGLFIIPIALLGGYFARIDREEDARAELARLEFVERCDAKQGTVVETYKRRICFDRSVVFEVYP